MKKYSVYVSVMFLAAIACNRPASDTGNSMGEQEKTGEQDAQTNFRLERVWSSDTTLRVPESCLYDEQRNVIYVSNVNFEPRVKDGNGFISRLSPEGEILDLKWITGMSAPKGMALVGTKLYTADVDELIEMDVETGRVTNRWMIGGSGMLNDITADESGALYISDTDKNRIIKFANGNYEIWLDKGITGPNGLFFEPERLLLASSGSQNFASINYDSKEITQITDSIGAGDGVESAGINGQYIVSDWAGRIFCIGPDGSRELLYQAPDDQQQTADVGFIAKDKILLVPTFFGNQVIAFRLVPAG